MIFQSVFDSSSILSAKLQGRKFSGNTTLTIPELKKISAVETSRLETLFRVISKEPLPDDFAPIMVASHNGNFKRMYGPIVCQEDGKLVLSAGLVQFPLEVKAGKIAHPKYEVEVTLEETSFDSYDKTKVIKISVFDEEKDAGVVFTLPLRLNFEKDAQGVLKIKKGDELVPVPKVDELAQMLKRKPNDLVAYLSKPPSPSMTTVAMKCLLPDSYDVVGYEKFTKKDGEEGWTLTVRGKVNSSGLLIQEYAPKPGDLKETLFIEMIQVYADKNLFGSLSLGPVISEEYPATLEIESVTPAKKENTFSVKWGWALNPDAPVEEEEDLNFIEI